ncbi:MAG: carbamoyltransferase C-terminal domain-containing protein [Candidatus Thiodiazotropha sp.]
MNKPVYVLGTALSHDGSSCLMKDGKIVVAIEKERLTRKKHDGFNDNATIKYCLDAEGIGFEDLDLIVEKSTFNPLKPDDREKRKGRNIPSDIPIVNISHHLAHAYSAVGTSPFEDMGVIVIDGQGSSLDNGIDITPDVLPPDIREVKKEDEYLYWENVSYYIFRNGKLTPVHKDFSHWLYAVDREKYPAASWDMEHSIGEFYEGVAHYVFNEFNCEGKLMGLAPYGKAGISLGEPFVYKNGRVFLTNDWWDKIDPARGGKYRKLKDEFQYYADIAYWAQRNLEKAVKYIFNSYYDMHPMSNVAYAGGVALNAVVNGKLYNDTKYDNFYFQPAAGDNGLSIGCAYYGWLKVLGNRKIGHNGSTYFGIRYSHDEIGKILSEYSDKIEYYQSDDYVEITANYLADSKVISWYQDSSEFGPRALGHRSILADPRIADMQDHINRNIKFREDFRPFAPSVLLEDASKYFEFSHESPYMIIVADVKNEWRSKIPAVVHVDGSARIQTVTQKMTPKYYSLIKQFKEKTGVPILLNTSLNVKGMPIVETPKETIEMFLLGELDVLVIHDYIVTKKSH